MSCKLYQVYFKDISISRVTQIYLKYVLKLNQVGLKLLQEHASEYNIINQIHYILRINAQYQQIVIDHYRYTHLRINATKN
jgi:helix-turn-helix protein